MPGKYTLEQVRDFIESVPGYKLLSLEYKSNKKPLLIQCPYGFQFSMPLNRFKNEHGRCRCIQCKGPETQPRQAKKYTYEEVKEIIESEPGYQLQSTEYKNIDSKLHIICPKGHPFEMSLYRFKNNKNRCPNRYCRYDREAANGQTRRPLLLEEVREFIESIPGYKMLSSEYRHTNDKLVLECPKGHIFQASFTNFKHNGTRCSDRECINELWSDTHFERFGRRERGFTYAEAKEFIESVEGYYLISTEYVNNHSPIDVACPFGHIFTTTLSTFKDQGSRCNQAPCYKSAKFTYDEVKEYVEQNAGYKLLSTEYLNGRTPLEFECPVGHRFKMPFQNFRNQGCRCSHRSCINKRIVETMMERYGVTHFLQGPTIKQKRLDTMMERYGVPNPLQDPTIKQRRRDTMIERYGVPNPLQNPTIDRKRRDTLMERYGPDYAKIFAEKARMTLFKKYGVYHPMQVPEFYEKVRKRSLSSKPYEMPSGNVVHIQGYEGFALDDLLKLGYQEEDIKVGLTQMPEIYYEYNDGIHRYYPDIYIPGEDRLLEIKSEYTMEIDPDKIYLKLVACRLSGYTISLHIYDRRGACIKQWFINDELEYEEIL